MTQQTKENPSKLLHTNKVEDVYGEPFTPTWLEARRRDGRGPRFLKAGRGRTSRVYYRPEDIERWISDNLHRSTSDTGKATEAA
jgi:hypothetical protein